MQNVSNREKHKWTEGILYSSMLGLSGEQWEIKNPVLNFWMKYIALLNVIQQNQSGHISIRYSKHLCKTIWNFAWPGINNHSDVITKL